MSEAGSDLLQIGPRAFPVPCCVITLVTPYVGVLHTKRSNNSLQQQQLLADPEPGMFTEMCEQA